MARDDDAVFRALADPTRRALLDALFGKDGMSLSELEADIDMTRFGVMKHLKVLVAAGLVTTRPDGRRTRHYLNAVPIHEIASRWLDKFTARRIDTLAELRSELETDP